MKHGDDVRHADRNQPLNPGDYTLTAEVGCAPGGGTCTGSFDFDLDVGDFVQP